MADRKQKKKSININPKFKIKNVYTKSKPKSAIPKSSYKIIKKIGEGSFGVVYLILYFKTSTNCVMKKIDLTGLSKEEIKESYNEVNILKKLDHPNIIKFIEVKPTKKYIEIITEYAENGDLFNQLCLQKEKNEYFPEKTLVDWLIQICQALKYIHSKHVIHRDIKPHNLFLTKKGFIKLGDFGVSKTLNNTLEKAKTFVGTAYYLPPELINGKKYSYMADMWSLGVTFYQLMTFKMPFDGKMLPAILNKIAGGEQYEKISKKYYSEELINLVYKMMDYRPSHRPKPNDILNMEFIRKRIKAILQENQFDDLLSKTIIKKYQDNYGYKKNKNDINEKVNKNKKKDVNNDKIDSKENNDKDNSNVDITNNENNEELFSFKNKIKFNNIVNNENASNSKATPIINTNIKITNTKNTMEKINKENTKFTLGQLKINSNNKTNSNTKEKEKEVIIPKIKIKIVNIPKKPEKITFPTIINNNEDEKIKSKNEDTDKFDSTLKTDMTSFNPTETKYKFEDSVFEKNKISHENGEVEIDLSNSDYTFLLETKKENELNQEIKEEYDHQRSLSLLKSHILGKPENEIENENYLINQNISDIEENDGQNEEDIDDNNSKD